MVAGEAEEPRGEKPGVEGISMVGWGARWMGVALLLAASSSRGMGTCCVVWGGALGVLRRWVWGVGDVEHTASPLPFPACVVGWCGGSYLGAEAAEGVLSAGTAQQRHVDVRAALAAPAADAGLVVAAAAGGSGDGARGLLDAVEEAAVEGDADAFGVEGGLQLLSNIGECTSGSSASETHTHPSSLP